MPAHALKAGAVRSGGEMSLYMSTVICPACGHEGLITYSDHALDGGDEVVVAHGQCAICNAYTDVTFRGGPGWGTEPTDDMHLAVGDQPSTLLPVTYFRTKADRALQRLNRADRSDHGVTRSRAATLICYLLELRKFRVAEGGDLEPA